MIRAAAEGTSGSGIPRIPVGRWIEDGFDWLKSTFDFFFDPFSDVITGIADGLFGVLTAFDALVLLVVFALLGWLLKNWRLGLLSVVLMAFIISVDQWDNAMSTFSLVAVAAAIALVLGIPVGILAARSNKVSNVVRPVMDLMQTMPAFVWLVPVVTLFSIGTAPGVVATVIFCLPPGVRFTELGIRQVDSEVVEAGHAFGSTPSQILRRIQIPLAMPTIMAGVNQVIMLALSMAVIAGLVGAGGLGGAVSTSISRLDIGLGFEAGLSVVALAIYLDRVTAAIGNRPAGGGRISRLLRHRLERERSTGRNGGQVAQTGAGA
ncbi:proline/glycine betaine ABC transporter permease [Nesterenkonia halophila]